MLQRLLFFSFFILSSGICTSAFGEIYGPDDRRDTYQLRDPQLKTWARAVAAITKTGNLKPNLSGGYNLTTTPLEKKIPSLCPTERFLKQPVGPFCTAFLVAPDIVASAGHCIVDEARCRQLTFVFDYEYSSRTARPNLIEPKQVYSCGKLLYLTAMDDIDFALVRLDRPVYDRKPLQLRSYGNVDPRAELILMGFPLGLPLKTAANGRVRALRGNSIYTTVDAFYKNSGSPAVSRFDAKVEGLLIGGEEEDFIVSPSGCKATHFCAEDKCSGNYLHSALPIAKKLAEFERQQP